MGDPKLSLNICLGSASVESALKKLVEDGTLKRIGTGRKTNYVNADAYEDICFIYYLSQTIEWRLDTIKHEEGNCYLYENVDMLKPEMKQ